MSVELIEGDCVAAMSQMMHDSVDSIVTDPPYHLVSIVKRFGADDAAPALSASQRRFAQTGGADRPPGTDQFGRLSKGFMGKTWDGGDIAFRPETWAAALRVLKPGGHLVAFGAPKNYHRLACAIEDAGFEIRDSLMWVFGSGFPKSLDVSKAIAKRRVEDEAPVRVVCRFIRAAMDARGVKSRDLTHHFGGCNPRLIDHWAARDTDSQPSLPTPAQWATLKAVLALTDDMDPEVARLNARKGEHGAAWTDADVIGEYEGEPGGFGDHRFSVRDNAIRALDDEAAEWQGWGTALKPAYEPIILARKPLIGTVAENALAHGTGALNIDACRVEVTGQRPYILQSWEQEPRLCASCAALAADSVKRATPETKEFTAEKPVAPITSDEEKSSPGVTDSGAIGCSDGTRADATSTSLNTSKCGKTPTDPCQTGTKSTTETETRATTNSAICRSCLKPITDDCTPSSMSGEKSGLSQGETRHAPIGRDGEPSANKTYAKNGSTNFAATPGPRGGSPAGRWPANFVHDGSEDVLAGFPVTGPSKSGLRGTQQRHDVSSPETARPKAGTNTVRGIDDAGGSAARFFYCAKAGKNDRAGSKHPTVKPIALMRWLVRLITPPGGVVLDPFAGSGTTGQAAMEEGFDAILIEREAEYQADIRRRLGLMPSVEDMLA